MKRNAIALFIALLAWGSAVAEPAEEQSPFLKGDALAAEVARNCADGCVVLSPAEAAALTASVQSMVNDRERRAFNAGREHEYATCRNRL